MHDSNIPASRVISYSLWGWVFILMAAAWLVSFVGDWHVAVLLGMTACVLSASAAAYQIRGYIIRSCRVIARAGSDDGRTGSRPTLMRN